MSIFTAGILLHFLDRKFHVVGCLVGKRTFPLIKFPLQEKVLCHVPGRDVPENGSVVSVVIVLDEVLQKAMAEPRRVGGFMFQIFEGDLVRVGAGVLIDEALEISGWGGGPPLLVLIASDTTWEERLIEEETGNNSPRYELCMVTVMKQYPHLLRDWISYYRRMGVDRFYIYDNDAVEDLAVYESPFVEVVYWPHARSQSQAFTHFLAAAGSRCKFVGFFDADEYVLVGDTGRRPLKRYMQLRRGQGFTQVTFIFLMMHNNGYIGIPRGKLPELYTKLKKGDRQEIGKVIVNVEAGWDAQVVHRAVGGNCRNYYNATRELNPQGLDSNAMLVHFTERSWEEYVAKQTVGGGRLCLPSSQSATRF